MGIVVNAGKMPVFQRIRQGGLKSREEKLKREQNRDDQVAMLEKQKADLKNKECGSLEEIEDKLGLLHSYEDQIRAVKQAYNMEQMHHILDEAREKGEKMAEELKKLAPKTEEERKKALQEEALGIEENQGILSELLDELMEEVTDGLSEEIPDELSEKIADGLSEEATEEPGAEATEDAVEKLTGDAAEETVEKLAGDAADKPAAESTEIPAESIEAALPERESEKPAKRHNAVL